MPRLFLFLLLSLAWAFPLKISHADSPILIDTVEIDLWPEYDQPNMLVIYHIFISANTPLPATLSLHIPVRVGDPAHVADREADGVLYTLPFTRTVSGDWSQVTFAATTREVQFEYYDPALIKNGPARTFTYEWQGEYSVNSLTFQVQQPTGASNMQIRPSLGLGIPGNGGITYYQSVIGTFSQGTKFEFSLQYQKSNDTLTAAGLKVQPAELISSQTSGRAPSVNYVIGWTLGGLGAVLLIGGGLWYWHAARSEPPQTTRKRHTLRPRNMFILKKATQSEISVNGAYCHQCGNRAREGDIFCRVCGTRLRKEES